LRDKENKDLKIDKYFSTLDKIKKQHID